MRVVAGRYKGRNILTPKDDSVRPTTTRIKETLFNVVQFDVPNCVALDLFAGSGALGIECISRGAKDVTFVDRSKESIALVNQNLKGIEGNFKVVNADFASVLRNASFTGKRFDLIFVDPPYATTLGETAIDMIVELDLLTEDGKIIFEHGSEKSFTLDNPKYKVRTKQMGTITAEFISRKRVALMAGSFDPITRGHVGVLEDVISRFDEVVVACLVNEQKSYTFNPAQRLALVEAVCSQYKNVRALYSTAYAVDVAKEVGAEMLVRGIRSDDDVEYENKMADYNREHGYETLFVKIDDYREVSSTKVREEIASGSYRNVPAVCVPLLQSVEFEKLV